MSFVMNAINQMHAASVRIDTGFNMMMNNQRLMTLTDRASREAIGFGSAGMPQDRLSQVHAQDKALMLRNLQNSTTLKIAAQIEKNAKEREKQLDFFA